MRFYDLFTCLKSFIINVSDQDRRIFSAMRNTVNALFEPFYEVWKGLKQMYEEYNGQRLPCNTEEVKSNRLDKQNTVVDFFE